MSRLLRTVLAGAVLLATPSAPALAQQAAATRQAQMAAPAAAPAGTRQLTIADMDAWKTIRATAISNDGKWFAYQLAPNVGDASVVVRPTAEGKEWRFPIGEAPVGGRGRFGAAGAAPVVVSGDSHWVAFTVYPTEAEAKKLKHDKKPLHDGVAIVNLATGEKREFDDVRRFAFDGDHPRWLAMHQYAQEAAPSAPHAAGADLLLLELATGDVVHVGDVGEFDFDESGDWLAYTVDAPGREGNGVVLRNLRSDVVRPLDSGRALYRQLGWSEEGTALAVLRGVPDSARADTAYSVLGFAAADAPDRREVVFDATQRKDFPAGMRVSPDQEPRWSEDRTALFFGIREATPAPEKGELKASPLVKAGAPGMGGTRNQPKAGDDDELPSLILWHYKDHRLQSQQLVQESQDRSYSYLSEYRVADDRFVRLADDALRTVTLAPHDRLAFGVDTRKYDERASYTGRRFEDVYLVDLRTGQRTMALERFRPSGFDGGLYPSPDGTQVLYWGSDGNWWTLDLASGEKRNITQGAPVSFVDTEDDHNNDLPPDIRPVGWAKDGGSVLLSDNWDVWRVPTHGGKIVNLTVDGRKTGKRYLRRYVFDPKEKGIDLSKPLYFAIYGERTKYEGLARVDASHPGAKTLVWEDASFDFDRARDADVFLYTRETNVDFPDWYVASADFKGGRRITDADPQQKEFAWSPGARLVDYVSDKGDSLQAALFLPAGYQPGQKYPTIVYIYEKLSQNKNHYTAPNAATRSAINPSVFTSRGYAVLMPDIVYRVNDPGMSAVWCVLPAVKAAIATGIVDPDRVGLQGHSWGGYQTAFLVTQTSVFKAAIAGAPLTNMVSMYGSIYWNSGGSDAAIFEASQGRFKGNFLDNYDAYIRNSPVFHADKVTTPLVILADDKDGAVDFNQGITYFNTLRQLGKKVILLEYVGENHGLARPVNMRDYASRQWDFFDHYLKGAPEPEWMKDGIPHLELEQRLRARLKAEEATKPAEAATSATSGR